VKTFAFTVFCCTLFFHFALSAPMAAFWSYLTGVDVRPLSFSTRVMDWLFVVAVSAVTIVVQLDEKGGDA